MLTLHFFIDCLIYYSAISQQNILSKKLQPFVSKKIVEYLGVQEDELVSFVIDHLRSKKSAAELTKEMEMV